MHTISESTLVEALTQWGVNEVKGRKSKHKPCDPNDDQACLNYILSYRSPYISRVIQRGPIKTYSVEFEARDIDDLLLADGRPIKKWIKDTQASGGDSLKYFNKLLENPHLIQGSLFCASQALNTGPVKLGPIVIYDGWHRVAAWAARIEQKEMARIPAYLIVTKKEDSFFRRE